MFDNILTASLTIIGGIIVFTSGQIISKFIIEPIYEQKKVIGEVADLLIFYANVFSNPGLNEPEISDKASDETRKLASKLVARTVAIPLYKSCNKCGLVLRGGREKLDSGISDKAALK